MTTQVIIAMAVAIALDVEGAQANTISDGGRAVGPGQMWPIAVRQANKCAGAKLWMLADRRDIDKVKAMMQVTFAAYLRRRPNLDPVALAALWRDPDGDAPAWHTRKLQAAYVARRKAAGAGK